MNFGLERVQYVHECRSDCCFAYGTLWNFNETVPGKKILKGGYHQRLCPSCGNPTTLLREEEAMPLREEELTDHALQTTLFPKPNRRA